MLAFPNIYIKQTLFIFCCFIFLNAVKAQLEGNKGIDFWTGYGAHSSMYNMDGSININGGSQQMIFYFSTGQDANVTVSIPATAWTKTYAVTGDIIAESDPMPKSGALDARLDAEGVSNNAIHITSDVPVLVYAHIFDNESSATSVLFPTNSLGQNYESLNYTQISDNKNSYSYCFIVATEDSTSVEVTPSANTFTHPANVPFTQMLQKGQVLTLFGAPTGNSGNLFTGADLTGTIIKSISGTNGFCKKIAAFSGSTSVGIDCNPAGNFTSDNIFQQMFPSGIWGKTFITVPTKGMNNNYFRIMVSDTTTTVSVNGIVLTNLINSTYYEYTSNQPSLIQTNTNVMVAQYITSANSCNNNVLGNMGDPEMIYLTPEGDKLNGVVLNSASLFAISSDYINVVMRTNDTSSFMLDGIGKAANFEVFQYDSTFSYAQLAVASGTHIFRCDSGLNAIAYGYGNLESYGYNCGFISNPPNNLTVQNPFAIPDTLQTCTATNFKMNVTLTFIPVSLKWDFLINPHLSPNNIVLLNNPSPDSSYNINNQNYYVFKLPFTYLYSTVETFTVNIVALKPTQDGCIIPDSLSYVVQVFQKPVAYWQLNNNTCVNDTLHFMDISNGFQKILQQWKWNFNNGDTSNVENPSEVFHNPGNYQVALRTINDIGCFADTVKSVFISSFPKANFNISGTDCMGNPTFFTDASTNAVGQIAQWSWNFGDSTTSAIKNPVKNYSVPGTYNITLWVTTPQGCISDTITKQWSMYLSPTVQTPLNLFVIEGNSIQITPVYQGTSLQYLWSPALFLNNDTTAFPVSTPKTSLFYHLLVTGAGGCTAKGDIYIDVKKFLEIPNAFSPNGDGINDTWVIKNIELYAACSVQVFNRYGQLVFVSTGYYKPWDGTYNGKPLPVGTYYYLIDTKDKFIPLKSGYVTILR